MEMRISPGLAMLDMLKKKRSWVWEQTLLLHKRAPETRVASSLSLVDILTVLFYAPILNYKSSDPLWSQRDRLIISKGHGSISLYPILADLGYFDMSELDRICKPGSFLGGIPDPVIPGYETVNGSLGHGPGVACGVAMALRMNGIDKSVYVITGDGELHEGAVWEAFMFAGHHRLDNMTLIVDNNHCAMLDHTDKILSIEPLNDKLTSFGWDVTRVDGHDIARLYDVLSAGKGKTGKPRAIIADTLKGKGVPGLENQAMSHIMTVKSDVIDRLLAEQVGGGN